MKNILLGSTALICIGLAASPSFAACTSTSPTSGQTVDCTGASSTPVITNSSQSNITVNVQDGGTLTVGAGPAVQLYDGGTINLLGNANVTTTLGGGQALAVQGANGKIVLNGDSQVNTNGTLLTAGAFISGPQGQLIMNDRSQITTQGTSSNGAQFQSDNGLVSLSGQSKIHTYGIGAIGIAAQGNANAIKLSEQSHVTTEANSATGIVVNGSDNNLDINNGVDTIRTSGNSADGIFLFGNGNHVSLSGQDVLVTNGNQSHGLAANGNDNVVTIDTKNSIDMTSGTHADAIAFTGARNSVTLNGVSSVQTQGNNSDGINITGDYGIVTLNQSAQTFTVGNYAHATAITGNHGAITLNGGSHSGTLGNYAEAAVIFGNDGRIVLNGQSALTTAGTKSYGAEAFGSRNSITLNGSAGIQTLGANAHGVYLNGYNNSAVLYGDSAILTKGTGAAGVWVTGASNEIDLFDRAAISSLGAGGFGIEVFGNSNTIALNGSSVVQTSGANAVGIISLGSGNNFMLSGHASIKTIGAGGYGVRLAGQSNQLQIDNGASIVATGAGTVAVLGSHNNVVNRGLIESDNGVALKGDNAAANSDNIFNAGRIIGNGTAIDLGDGNDSLVLSTGSDITGSIDGGLGNNDTVTLQGSGNEDDQFFNFENLIVANAGSWSLSGNSTFSTGINVTSGRLAVNGALISPVTTVGAAGILGGTGMLVSDVTSIGHIAPGNSVGTLTINGNFTQTGGAFDVQVDKNGVDRLNVLGALGATLASSPTLNVLPQSGATGGAGIILHASSGITGSFGTINYQGNGAADVTQTATDIRLITVDGTPEVGSAFAASETGLDYLDSVNDEQLAGLRGCGTDTCDRTADQRFHLWAKGFGRFGNEAAEAGNQSFDYRIAGSAVGGDMSVANGLRLGVSVGYSNTDETLAHNAADADIDTTQAALYANYQQGPYFVTGLVSGGWQHFDQSRQVGFAGALSRNGTRSNGGEADSSTHGWLFGSSLQAGARFRFPKGWMLTPSAGVSYQHQWINGTSEHGGGAADVAFASHQADALRLKAQLVLSQDYELSGYTITPHVKLGVQQQYNLGGQAAGTFSDGKDFTIDLMKTDRTIGLAGVGFDVAFDNGFSTYVDYDGALASGRTVQAVTGGLRYSW